MHIFHPAEEVLDDISDGVVEDFVVEDGMFSIAFGGNTKAASSAICCLILALP